MFLPLLLLLSLLLLLVFWITIILLHLLVYLPLLTRTVRILHALPTPAATAPSTTVAATPTAPAAAPPATPAATSAVPAASGKFQRYQWGRRMSNQIYDHHSVCFVFIGFDGTWHHCGECFFFFFFFSDVQFPEYFEHQNL